MGSWTLGAEHGSTADINTDGEIKKNENSTFFVFIFAIILLCGGFVSVTAPMKYAERTALGQHLTDEDHDLLIDMYRGFTASGTFVTPDTLYISYTAPDYYASNAYQTVYGGSSDVGGVDGADLDAVLDAALALGGSVVFKASTTYPIASQHSILDNTTVSGEKGAILDGSGMAAGTPMFLVDAKSNVHVSGLKFLDATNIGVKINGASDDVTVENCWFENCDFGVTTAVTGATVMKNITVQKCLFTNQDQHAIAIQGGIADPGQIEKCIVDNCYFYNSGDGTGDYSCAIDVENLHRASGKSHIIISNVIADSSWEDGVHLEKITGEATVSNCTFRNNGLKTGGPVYGTGVIVADVTNCIISNNHCIDNIGKGIQIHYQQTHVQSLKVIGNTIADNDGGGIKITYDANPTQMATIEISGNTITNNGYTAGVAPYGAAIYAYGAQALGTPCNFTFKIHDNTFNGNFIGLGGDQTYGEVFMQVQAATTTYRAYIQDNIFNPTNTHVYAIVLQYAYDYTVKNNVFLSEQRGFSITNSTGTMTSNQGATPTIIRQLFIPISYTDGTLGAYGNYMSASLPDGSTKYAYGNFTVPQDFDTISQMYVLLVPQGATGDIHANADASFGTDNESYTAHSTAAGGWVLSLTSDKLHKESLDQATLLANMTKNDYVGVKFYRKGGEGDDSLLAAVHVLGFILEYYADS